MAITTPVSLTKYKQTAAQTGHTTASISPSLGGAVVLVIRHDALMTLSTVVSDAGLTGTWSQIFTNAGSDTFLEIAAWKADSLTGSGTVTVTFTGTAQADTYLEILDTAATVVGGLDTAATAATGDETVNTSAMAAGNGVIAFCGTRARTNVTCLQDTGWTESMDDTDATNPASFHTQFRVDEDTECVFDLSNNLAVALGAAVELNEAAASGGMQLVGGAGLVG